LNVLNTTNFILYPPKITRFLGNIKMVYARPIGIIKLMRIEEEQMGAGRRYWDWRGLGGFWRSCNCTLINSSHCIPLNVWRMIMYVSTLQPVTPFLTDVWSAKERFPSIGLSMKRDWFVTGWST